MCLNFFFCLVDSGHILFSYRRYWNFMVIHSLRGNNLSCETFQTGHMISPPKRTKFSQKKCPLAKRSYIVSSHPKIMRKKEDKTKRDRNIANINRVKQTNTEPKSNVYELDQERSFHCRFVCADILCFSNYINSQNEWQFTILITYPNVKNECASSEWDWTRERETEAKAIAH